MAKSKPKSPAPSNEGADSDSRSAEPLRSEAMLEHEGDSLEEAIAKLTPEQTEMFMKVLTQTMKKRRIMVFGNLLALGFLLAGIIWAFFVYANRDPASFSAWVFLVPFASAGVCLWLFGRLASQAAAKTTLALDEGRQAQARKRA